MALALAELPASGPRWGQFIPYPGHARQTCDLYVGDPLEWAIEVKMVRLSATTPTAA